MDLDRPSPRCVSPLQRALESVNQSLENAETLLTNISLRPRSDDLVGDIRQLEERQKRISEVLDVLRRAKSDEANDEQGQVLEGEH